MNFTKTVTAMVNRRMKLGFSKDSSADLLKYFLDNEAGDDLVEALVNEGFATKLQAERLAKYLAS